MAKFSRTWWGDRFIQALEAFTDDNRLKRGRSYASGGKVKTFEIDLNKITAKVLEFGLKAQAQKKVLRESEIKK